MTTTICLKQTVYWTFRVLVDTWEEVLTWWLSSRGDVLRTVSIRLLKSLFSVSVGHSLVSLTPAWITTTAMFSSSFRIAGICAETSRARAPGKQWVCTLPSANVARTCRTIESPMTTAVTGGDLEDRRGRSRRPGPGLRLPLLHSGSWVSRRRSEGHLGRSSPGCTGPRA